MLYAKWHLVSVLLALAAGAGTFAALRRRTLPERLLAASLPLLLYLIPATAAVAIGSSSFDVTWTNARLVPSLAFAKGLDAYSTLETGSVQTSIYPPGWVLAYLPAALGTTPTAVILIGHCLTHAFALLPAVAFFWAVSRSVGTTVVAAGVFELFMYRMPPLESCYFPHADAPALGWGLVALLLFWLSLQKPPEHVRWWTTFFATGAAWLALWTKQVMAPLLPAMALWMALAGGVRPLLRFGGAAAASGLAVGLPLLALFPVEGVVFNTILLLQRCPWVGETPWNLLVAFGDLTREGLPLLLLLVVGAAATWGLWRRRTAGADADPDAWRIVALAALVLVPTSVLGRVKFGGWWNTLSPTLYTLLAAVCLLLPCAQRRARGAPRGSAWPARVEAFTAVLALVLAFCWSAMLFSDLSGRQLFAGKNAAQRAFEHLQRNDPRAYFPVHPLAHLMAQGVLYHYSSAVYDREFLGGARMSRLQRKQFFPAKPSMLCWKPQSWGDEYFRSKYLKRYSVPVSVPGLRGFRCLARAASAEKP